MNLDARPDAPLDPMLDSVRLQDDAAACGFDWNNIDDLWAKLEEEIGELREAVDQSHERRQDELGDLMFMVLNLARRLKLDPVQALAGANAKFRRRFAVVLEGESSWQGLSGAERLHAMEALWQRAKAEGL